MPPFSALAFDYVMAGVAHRTVALASTRTSESTTAPLRSTALTATALAALALGLALLLLPGPHFVPELPPALFAGALGMLIATLLLDRVEPSAVPAVDSYESTPAAEKADSAVTSSARPATPGTAVKARSGPPERASAWRILSSPSGPGDETWLSWLPRETRRLGSDASVAPGVVTSPGRAGNLVAFPVRDYYGGALPPVARGSPSAVPPKATGRGLVGDEYLPALSSPRAAPFSEEELDRMFPPEGRRGTVFLAEAPDRIGGRPAWPDSAGFARGTIRPPESSSAEPDDVPALETAGEVAPVAYGSNEDEGTMLGEPPRPGAGAEPAPSSHERGALPRAALNLEASNPIPPHLRSSGPLLRFEPQPSSRKGNRASPSRSVCASCSKVVVDLRLSGPCPKCLRPLCNDCLREAFVTEGHGWCLDCASADAVAG